MWDVGFAFLTKNNSMSSSFVASFRELSERFVTRYMSLVRRKPSIASLFHVKNKTMGVDSGVHEELRCGGPLIGFCQHRVDYASSKRGNSV